MCRCLWRHCLRPVCHSRRLWGGPAVSLRFPALAAVPLSSAPVQPFPPLLFLPLPSCLSHHSPFLPLPSCLSCHSPFLPLPSCPSCRSPFCRFPPAFPAAPSFAAPVRPSSPLPPAFPAAPSLPFSAFSLFAAPPSLSHRSPFLPLPSYLSHHFPFLPLPSGFQPCRSPFRRSCPAFPSTFARRPRKKSAKAFFCSLCAFFPGIISRSRVQSLLRPSAPSACLQCVPAAPSSVSPSLR